MNTRRSILPLCLSAALFFSGSGLLQAGEYKVSSPGGKITINVRTGDRIYYSVEAGGREMIGPSAISMTVNDTTVLGLNPKGTRESRRSVDEKIFPPVKEKKAVIIDRYNELTLRFKGGYGLIFRAYDDGAAYRFFVATNELIKVNYEEATFAFAGEPTGWIPFVKSMHTSFESSYTHLPLKDVGAARFCYIPVLVDLPDGAKAAVAEADIESYPGIFLAGNDEGLPVLKGKFAPYPLEEKFRNKTERTLDVSKAADYIALTRGPRSFPWRAILYAEKDADLIGNDLVYRLGPPLAIKDTSWIRPGKVAWDWWNDWNIYGVDFRAGINTATYKYYIDFAAGHGIEYVILDEGWSELTDLLKINPDIDMDELSAYAAEKKVGLILWCVWGAFDRQMDAALDRFAKWGVKGVKIDFMDRDDQKVVEFYRRVAKAAADRKMLVDFHGAFKPDGLRRAYPNIITREGVMGLEACKWSDEITPDHDLILPFTRMLAGPMDFTPGAMINARKEEFRAIGSRPMSQGTRTHQLAMYVAYESPLQMLCDSPSNYEREPDSMAFLSSVPTVWDETRVLEAKAGDYLVIARRNGKAWYVSAMTDWTPRKFEISLDFLGEGEWRADIFADGVNADRRAEDLKRSTRKVAMGDKLTIEMAPGGGWAAKFEK